MILTQEEANRLISMLKRTVDECLVFPHSREENASFLVIGDKAFDEFVVNIDRKGVLDENCTYQGRVRLSNQILMRLDIGKTLRHTNPKGAGGDTIVGNHLHVYREEYDMACAVPFDANDDNLYEICYTFFERFNVIEPPEIIDQIALDEGR